MTLIRWTRRRTLQCHIVNVITCIIIISQGRNPIQYQIQLKITEGHTKYISAVCLFLQVTAWSCWLWNWHWKSGDTDWRGQNSRSSSGPITKNRTTSAGPKVSTPGRRSGSSSSPGSTLPCPTTPDHEMANQIPFQQSWAAEPLKTTHLY